MRSLDFNALKKQYLPVTLNDEKKTKLLIGTPSKRVLDDFIRISQYLGDENAGDEAIAELYDGVARVMSHNKAGIKIDRETVEELLDFEDVILFIRAYTAFIDEVVNAKN